jgi:hypothetical protein
MTSRPSRSITPASVRVALNRIGVLILLAGFTSAALVWHSQNGVDPVSDDERLANSVDPLAISDSRKQSRQVEIYYGKTGVLMERWSEDWQTLTRGKALAKTIAVVTSITAGACFLIGTRLSAGGRPDETPRPLEGAT